MPGFFRTVGLRLGVSFRLGQYHRIPHMVHAGGAECRCALTSLAWSRASSSACERDRSRDGSIRQTWLVLSWLWQAHRTVEHGTLADGCEGRIENNKLKRTSQVHQARSSQVVSVKIVTGLMTCMSSSQSDDKTSEDHPVS
jgi:hypothetical protein